MATIAVLGTFDTKGEEHGFVADAIRRRGHAVLAVDVGVTEPRTLPADITAAEVARAGGADLALLAAARDRGAAVAAMAKGAPIILEQLARSGRIQGVIALGGGGGTAIATAAMRALPIGFPKLMVSTLASGNTAQYIGFKDIVMMPSVVDVAGLNRVSRPLLAQAAGAICGMVETPPEDASGDRPVIVASQFGNTTACVNHARERLDKLGFEVLVFHATGVGGRTMESLIDSGMVAGVLDITTTEWADELVGGILGAGPTRCEAGPRRGLPCVITPGCLDMVNFGEPATVPERFRGRLFYQHNPQVTLMRTTVAENRRLGEILAEKCNLATGPITVLFPHGGVSVISAKGGPFHSPEADEALFESWRANLRQNVEVIDHPGAVNDPAFADLCVDALLRGLAAKAKVRG
jgi:uncharacterized protein (UPF0261 family)